MNVCLAPASVKLDSAETTTPTLIDAGDKFIKVGPYQKYLQGGKFSFPFYLISWKHVKSKFSPLRTEVSNFLRLTVILPTNLREAN